MCFGTVAPCPLCSRVENSVCVCASASWASASKKKGPRKQYTATTSSTPQRHDEENWCCEHPDDGEGCYACPKGLLADSRVPWIGGGVRVQQEITGYRVIGAPPQDFSNQLISLREKSGRKVFFCCRVLRRCPCLFFWVQVPFCVDAWHVQRCALCLSAWSGRLFSNS